MTESRPASPQDSAIDKSDDGDKALTDPAFPQREYTWLDEAPTPPIIEKFLAENWYATHWESIAECAKDLVQDEVRRCGLQAIVTCRAKQEDSLRKKLKLRYESKKYETIADIRNDLYDLAGVRIILIVSTPEQRDKVKAIIRSIWGEEIFEKRHRGSAQNTRYQAKHIGYEAVHYRPFMKKEQGKNGYRYKEGDRVEVQVVSALGNAWAEAGHDVLYKTHAYGEPSLEENRILDALNGFVRSGELLLEQFHEAFMRRTTKKWEHRDQLVTYLREVDVLQVEPQFMIAGTDLLFKFLQHTEQHYPLAVRNALMSIGMGRVSASSHLDEIISGLKPSVLPISDVMRVTVCLIHRMMDTDEGMPKFSLQNPYQNVRPHEVPNCIAIMMVSLTILHNFAGDVQNANIILEQSYFSNAERMSLIWILGARQRQEALEAKADNDEFHRLVRPAILPLWNWFLQEATKRRSIHRICFVLAQIQCSDGMINNVRLLEGLRLPPLARSTEERDNGPRDFKIYGRTSTPTPKYKGRIKSAN
ncbi:unnamed protein product [Periconia digitata]|uniref:RelA/SpoT domain-containing protein n=1 Tax=Periconia digitata TaxID=1303443 RepID=A0A9W4XSI5_9PLEO|nr:unnamed protein product [Periconia digitata]